MENKSIIEVIYFNTTQALNKILFESFFHDHFKSNEFIWATNSGEFIIENKIDKQKTYVLLDTSDEGFKFHYTVFDSCNLGQTLREQIEILKNLAQKLSIQILSTDDEINPWSMVLIEPNGQTSTIVTKDADVLVIDNFYNFSFGDFRTKTNLTVSELNVLKKIVEKIYPNIDINHGYDGPVLNGDFNKVKNNFDQLKLFDNHYEVVPVGKNTWIDMNEKSEIFVNFMLEFHKQIDKDLCVFPRNYSEVKNIKGGSCSEEFCLIVTNGNIEKIVYKQRRKS